MQKLFVYGTLKNPETRKRVIGRAVKGMPDILENFALTTIKINSRSYFAAVKKRNCSIKGVVLEVTKRALEKIDSYEGARYKRIKVKLKTARTEAWVYVKSDV